MKIINAIIAILFIAIAAAPLHSRVINIPADYPTIQAGIDASINGDTVLVAAGRYAEILTISDNITLSSSNGPDLTIIQGSCRFQGNIDSTCVVRGFAFADDGRFDPYLHVGVDDAPKIEGNILRGKFWVSAGGAVACYGGNPIIRSNIINNNHATFIGGGICFENSSPPYTSHAEVSYNIISNNWAAASWASGYGGGIYLQGDATIKYNVIYNNQAYCYNVSGGLGGGIMKVGSSEAHHMIIVNNTIVNNSALYRTYPSDGAGIYIRNLSSIDAIVVKNNIFAFNTQGGNISMNLNDSAIYQWDYNLIYGDTTSIFPQGEHDIIQDPLFADTAGHDYHLLSNSPCIDAGDPSSPLDPDSTRADIGAYYFDQGVGIDDGTPSEPYQFSLRQNYPNPFNAETIISYDLEKDATVSLRIIAITGQLVKSLADQETQVSGEHRYIWDGRDKLGKSVSTGIYFYELYVDDYRASKAMIIIR